MSENALIIFTRVPVAGKTKTRLMPYFTGEECAELHTAFLKDIAAMSADVGADVFVAYEGENDGPLNVIFGSWPVYFEQSEGSLGQRMSLAMENVLERGYEKCVLIGTDMPYAKAADIDGVFSALDVDDLVFGPVDDGGYWLVGAKTPVGEILDLHEYSHSRVLSDTIGQIPAGMTHSLIATGSDVDEIEDLEFCREVSTPDSYTGQFLMRHHVISVVVPVYNEVAGIVDFLSELDKLDERCDVIFVDGGSTDGTVDMLEKNGKYRVIRGSRGRGAQMNAGAKAARGDILWFLHADAELPNDPVEEIRVVMDDHEVGCFGIAFHSRNFFMWTNRVISNHRASRRNIVFGDQGMFIRRKLFTDMGMFQEIPLMEDFRFSLELREKGIPIGMTDHRLYVSDRRYKGSTVDKLLVMKKMYVLRRRYLAGEDIETIAREYGDIR